MNRIRVWLSRLFRNHHFDRLVAERLRGKDIREQFVDRIVRSMKEHPEEWTVKEWTAKHRSGVLIDCKDIRTLGTDPNCIADKIYGSIRQPTQVLLSKEECEKLGDAFDYLAKLRLLEMVHMDKE